MEEGHVQSGQVGFPLLVNKELQWGQETWISAFYKLHSFEEVMFTVGKWASLAAEQSIGCSQEALVGRLYKVDFVGACSEWASGLSLATQQSIGRSQEAWIGRFYKVDFVEEGHVFRVGKWAFPCC